MPHTNISVWVTGFLSVVLVGLLLPILTSATDPHLLMSYALVFLNILCVLIGFMLNKARNGSLDIFDPLIYVQITFASLFCLRTLLFLNQGGVYLDVTSANDLRAMNLALMYTLIWLCVLYVAYYSRMPRIIFTRLGKLPPMSRKKVRFWVPTLFLVGLTAWGIKTYIIGGIESIFYLPNVAIPGFYPLNLLGSLVTFAFYLSLAAGIKYRNKLLLRYAVVSGLIAFGKAVSSFSKGQVFTFCIGTLIVYYLSKGRMPNKLKLGILAVALLGVFSFFESWRSSSFLPSKTSAEPFLVNVSNLLSSSFEETLQKGGLKGGGGIVYNREGIEAFAIIVRDTDRLHFMETLYNSLIIFIPRAVWPDKPIVSEGVLFGRDYLGETGMTAYTMTIPGSAYRNLHVAGIVLSAYLIGIMLRGIYQHLRICKNRETAAFLYAVLFPALGYFVEVGILDLISGILPLAVVGLFIIVLVRERPRRSARIPVNQIQ